MSLPELIDEALRLKPHERYLIIDRLVQSLDVPDSKIEQAWITESQHRLEAYRNGTAKVLTVEQVFGNEAQNS